MSMKNIKSLIIVCLFCSACKYQGTDTGNPASVPVADDTSAAYVIAANACDRVASCIPTSVASDCLSLNKDEQTFGVKLGLVGPQQNWTLSEIISYEISGDIIFDESARDTCLGDIEGLSCSANEIQDSYNINLTNPYEKLSDVLPPSCTNVFLLNQ